MSQSATPTTSGTTAPPVFTRTDFFTYTTGGHRDPTQVWTVTVSGESYEIYIQGDVTSVGFPSITETHFAKKHLLSFTGGKAATAGTDIIGKMQRIADKRARAGLTNSQKKDPTKIPDSDKTAYWQKITGKYAGSVTKKNTFIKVDAMTPDDLKKVIAEALVAGNGLEAHADFPAAAVWYLEIGGTATQLSTQGTVKIGLGYEKTTAGNKFVIKHLET